MRTDPQQNDVTVRIVGGDHPAALTPQAGQQQGPRPPKRELRFGRRLRRVFSLVPEYLRGDAERAGETVPNYMDYGIQLGRRFRALKAWFVIRAFGREGLAARVREACRLARVVAGWVEADDRFELLAPVLMGVVCFRARALPGGAEGDTSGEELDELNERLLARVNATGAAFITHTRLRGRIALRIAVGNVLTRERNLAQTWELVRLHYAGLL